MSRSIPALTVPKSSLCRQTYRHASIYAAPVWVALLPDTLKDVKRIAERVDSSLAELLWQCVGVGPRH